MNNEQEIFVDEVFDYLTNLYNKDKNPNRIFLGDDPIITIFEHYSDWIVNNFNLSPKVVANEIYKDVINVNYSDFKNKKLKKGFPLKKGNQSFNIIYGSQKEIEKANEILRNLEIKNPNKHRLIVTALQKVKQVSDKIKPQKNIFGKNTNFFKQEVSPIQNMPRFTTLELFLKKNDKELMDYINKYDKTLKNQ